MSQRAWTSDGADYWLMRLRASYVALQQMMSRRGVTPQTLIGLDMNQMQVNTTMFLLQLQVTDSAGVDSSSTELNGDSLRENAHAEQDCCDV